MRIFYFVRQINMVPSCIYNILMLKELGYEVIPVFGSTTRTIQSSLEAQEIKSFYKEIYPEKRLGIKGIIYYFQYRRYAYQIFRKQFKKGDIAFLGTADSAISLFDLHKYCKVAICIKELYEQDGINTKLIKLITRKTNVVIACEKNRARMMKAKWGLKTMPYVLSNKPYVKEDTKNGIPITTELTKEIAERIKGKKVILYQGFHVGYPEELANVARALQMINSDYVFLLMGIISDEAKNMIQDIFPATITTGLIPAPTHMEITQFARIGITMYSEDKLNNLFCAPNKIYEYAEYGIPSLCIDLPGLVETVGISGAGVCVDIHDVECIAKAIEEIDQNYNEYSERARKFYDSEDNLLKIQNIVNDLTS